MALTLNNTKKPLPYLPQEMWNKIMYFKDVSEHNDLTEMLVKEIKTERAKDTEEDWENCKCFKRINGGIAPKPWFELTHAYNEFYANGEIGTAHQYFDNFYQANNSRAYEEHERMFGNVLLGYEEDDGDGWYYCASKHQIDII
tara:strand:+ start:119 stop:547 length:429 start_codon:yes stop_codon:yes gene_type:complete